MEKGWALVTGGSSGIGEALAHSLAERGYSIFLVARRSENLKKIAEEIKDIYEVDAKYKRVDLLNVHERETLCSELAEKYELDVVVNNAGFGLYGWFDELNKDKQMDMIELNITALVDLTHSLLPILQRNAQSMRYVLNVASVAAFQPGPFYGIYYASKAFVLNFSEALAEELRKKSPRVRVSVLCPGPTQSDFFEVSGLKAGGKSLLATQFQKMPSAKTVAEYGVTKMLQSQVVIVCGKWFKILIFIQRALPRWAVRMMVGKIQEFRGK